MMSDPKIVAENAALRRLMREVGASFGPFLMLAEQPPDLVVGQPPAGFPAELSSPPGGDFLGAFVAERLIIAFVAAPMSADELRQHYATALLAAGWTPREFGPALGGFPPGPSHHVPTIYDQPGGAAVVVINARDTTEGASASVLLSSLPAFMGRSAPPPHSPHASLPLPDLAAPTGSRQQGLGGSASDDLLISHALLASPLPVSDLAAHYEAALQGAGWRRTAGAILDDLAWSRWEVPRDGALWEGLFFMARRSAPDHYTLLLRALGPRPGLGQRAR